MRQGRGDFRCPARQYHASIHASFLPPFPYLSAGCKLASWNSGSPPVETPRAAEAHTALRASSTGGAPCEDWDPNAAPSLEQLFREMEQRLPPADILEVPGSRGYLVMRRHKAEPSPAAACGAPYQRVPRRLPAAHPEPQRPLEVPAANAAAPQEPAVWTAEDEKRYQGQLEHLQLLVRLGLLLEQRLAEERAAAGIPAEPGTATSAAASPAPRVTPLRPQWLCFDCASPAVAQGKRKRQAGPSPCDAVDRPPPMPATWTKETFGASTCEAPHAPPPVCIALPACNAMQLLGGAVKLRAVPAQLPNHSQAGGTRPVPQCPSDAAAACMPAAWLQTRIPLPEPRHRPARGMTAVEP
jgi:hypothetical protein